jgi:hypothetical protein
LCAHECPSSESFQSWFRLAVPEVLALPSVDRHSRDAAWTGVDLLGKMMINQFGDATGNEQLWEQSHAVPHLLEPRFQKDSEPTAEGQEFVISVCSSHFISSSTHLDSSSSVWLGDLCDFEVGIIGVLHES